MASSIKSSPDSTIHTSKVVVALNGFLGRTVDWDLIKDLLPADWSLLAIDLLDESLLMPFGAWAAKFNELVARKLPVGSTKILLGYSMGGRLALHALAQSPTLFDGAVIVSANPGLLNDEERALRRQADEIWATKLLHEPWDALMNEWNSQAAFRAPKNVSVDALILDRAETHFNRSTLAQILRHWSLGAQRNLRGEIANLNLPIEFVTGKGDVKFTAIASGMVAEPANGPRNHIVVANAGHRVPWDAPTQFRAILAKFLSRW